MRDQLVLGGALHSGERKKPGVIAEIARDMGFLAGLVRAAGEAGDHDRRDVRPLGRGAHRELEHRLIKADVADRELRGVDADREPAGAGVEVVAGERALAPRVELARRIKRERMRRNGDAAAQRRRARVSANRSSAGSSSLLK